MKIEVTFDGKKKVKARMGRHLVMTDKPATSGGDDVAVTPYDLFLTSLATCAGIYIKDFCDYRGFSTDGITLTQTHHMNDMGFATKIDLVINLPEGFPEKYVESLIRVAGLCKVNQQLLSLPELSVKSRVVKKNKHPEISTIHHDILN